MKPMLEESAVAERAAPAVRFATHCFHFTIHIITTQEKIFLNIPARKFKLKNQHPDERQAIARPSFHYPALAGQPMGRDK